MGALDMGGASTQITFVPRGPVLDESTQATFHLYGFEHSVYTHSYLCFGRDQMLQRLLAALVQVGLRGGGLRGAGPQPPGQVLKDPLPTEQPGPPCPPPVLPQRLPGHRAPGHPV